MAVPTILTPGAKVGGKYEVVEVLGFGGMGVVYKVREQVGAVSRIRALKTVLPQYAADKAVATRFRQEAEKMCLLEHENIVPVLSYSEEGEFPYIVMPFIEGQTLKDYLAGYVAEHGRGLPLAETMEIGLEVIRGLEVAHRFVHPETQRTQPMVHRDIKPGNVMVRVENQGGERRLKVLIMDFGIAKVLSSEDSGHTLTEVIGTVKYASPEQVRRQKDIDPRADIYSLGVMLYELFCGRHLFAGINEHTVLMRMMQKDLQDHEVTFPDEAPERFRQLVLRAVAVNREQRFANVGEMRSAMRRILEEDTERAATTAKNAHDFARSERARALEQQADRFASASLAAADLKLAEGEAVLTDRRYPQAASILRTAAEGFARAADDAAEGRERERLDAARAGLAQMQARAVAANAADLAELEVAAAAKAGELFEKALAGGDLSGASRALAQAERAWREAEARATRESARRDAMAAAEEVDHAIAARIAELGRVPPPLRNLAGAGDLGLVEAQAKAARAAITAGDFAAAAAAARGGVAMLAEFRSSSEKALGDAATERERRFTAELSSIETDEDLSLAASLHSEAVTTGREARARIAAGEYPDAILSLDRALDTLKTLAREIASQRAERDRKLEAAERNRRAEPDAHEAAAALRRARERLAALEQPRGEEAAELAAITAEAATGEREAATGEFASAAPRLREAADRLEQLCDRMAVRQAEERDAARLASLRGAATEQSQELAALGSDGSAEARRLLAALTSAEEHAGAGDRTAAIRILEEAVPGLEALVVSRRAELERARRESAARSEIARAVQACEVARGLGERATASPAFGEAASGLDDANRAFERGDFTAAHSGAAASAQSFAGLAEEVRRLERDERLSTLRTRRSALDARLASLPATRAARKAKKALGKPLAKLDTAMVAGDDVQARRLMDEVERWAESLESSLSTARAGASQTVDASKPAIPWRIVAIGGVVAAAGAMLWLALGRSPVRPPQLAEHDERRATELPTQPARAETAVSLPTVPPATPVVEATIAVPTAVPTALPVAPSGEPASRPLVLASAQPAGRSVTIRAGAQQRFDATLKDANDAVLQWRLGGDAVGIGESFVLGKPLSEKPGKKMLEVVASRGHDHATLRSWEVEISPPPIGFGKLDPAQPKLERAAGSTVAFRAPVTGVDMGGLSFEWQVNGKTDRGADGPGYEFAPTSPGEYQVSVRATAPWGETLANTWRLSIPAPTPAPIALKEPTPRPSSDSSAEAQQWIQAYCNAFQTKNTDALIALGHVKTQGEASRLREALAAMTNLRVSCSNTSVRVTGDQAIVSFDRTDHWTDPRGSEMERALPRITKTLRRSDGRWVAVQ